VRMVQALILFYSERDRRRLSRFVDHIPVPPYNSGYPVPVHIKLNSENKPLFGIKEKHFINCDHILEFPKMGFSLFWELTKFGIYREQCCCGSASH
jgi:hypothetical protein